MAFSRSCFLAANAIQSAGWFHVSGLRLYSMTPFSSDINSNEANAPQPMTYTIESLTDYGWSDDPTLLGGTTGCNVFASLGDAQSALNEAQRLWPDATLRIHESESCAAAES